MVEPEINKVIPISVYYNGDATSNKIIYREQNKKLEDIEAFANAVIERWTICTLSVLCVVYECRGPARDWDGWMGQQTTHSLTQPYHSGKDGQKRPDLLKKYLITLEKCRFVIWQLSDEHQMRQIISSIRYICWSYRYMRYKAPSIRT